MGKLDGFVKIVGTLDDLTFYKTADGHLIRKKGGVSRNRIKSDPAFRRTRENGVEFGHSAKAGKMLRIAVGPLLFKAKDRKLISRLMTVMTEIKSFDVTSARGQRQVAVGIGTPEGKLALKGFDFNAQAGLTSVFHPPVQLDPATGTITVATFEPERQIVVPEGTTHFSLQCAFIRLDFATGEFDATYSPLKNLRYDRSPIDVSLSPSAVPGGSGTAIYLLLVEFFQEFNGQQYDLNNGAYNVLAILDVV